MMAVLTPDFQLERDAFGRLVLVLASGERHEGVLPVRAFPITSPEEGLSLVGTEGRELVWVPQTSSLPPAVWALLSEELANREFVPEIRRLKAVSTFSTPSVWTVETDRGETRFILKTEEDIRRLGEGRLLIASSHGLQLLVPDRFALDRPSKRILERFL